MKLWLISRPREEVDYDEYDAKVVRAETADRARDLADDTRWPSFPMDNATIVELTTEGDEGIVLGSFNAG